MASAFGWLAACVSFAVLEKAADQRLVAAAGIGVALLLVLMKLLPVVPGHFTHPEWLALGIWLSLGLLLYRRASLP